MGGRRDPAFSQPFVSTGAWPDSLMFLIPPRTASQFSGALATQMISLVLLMVHGYKKDNYQMKTPKCFIPINKSGLNTFFSWCNNDEFRWKKKCADAWNEETLSLI